MDINSRPEHSQLCENSILKKKCYSCYRSSRNAWQNKDRASKREKKASLPKTRNNTKAKTIYKRLFCEHCEDKVPKYISGTCKTARNKKSRQNVRQKK